MDNNNITIDGSQGEGGGQILRTSLSLAMCLGKNIKVVKIRAGRKKPGLLRQHLTCVRAAQTICNAKVSGDELGSDCIEFKPTQIQGGDYHFSIGSAGSTNLVFQTILPALLKANIVSNVHFEGGTHNQQAPSYEFITKSFLNTLSLMNINVSTQLERYGFYPNGGGLWYCQISPTSTVKQLSLLEKGRFIKQEATTYTAKIANHVSQRELKQVAKRLSWEKDTLNAKTVDSFGPGNLLSLSMEYESHRQLFESVAKHCVRAESVADSAIEQLLHYKNSPAAVGEYLADQLLLPMALNAGGTFITHILSEHVKTNVNVINQFINSAIKVSKTNNKVYKISVNALCL
ncbi:RNA 3'-terminal phosphate cyclase [Aliikangiella sp. IMCC44359]|uniref:RNA 3'-terminal phosphate cyclase n=1 Tax=Aliikangiella sp. IMCC44359 TaxID=3459125 RepID=UPI00403A9325